MPHWTQSAHFPVNYFRGILQILQVVPSSSSLLRSSFDDLPKLLNCCNVPASYSSWGSSPLTTVPDVIFFSHPLSFSRKHFWHYFAVTSLWVSRSLRHMCLLGKWLSGVSSKFASDSMGNSYVKRIIVKVVVEILK